MEETRLTEHSRFGGCAAKVGPSKLAGMLCGIDIPQDENVIAGIEGYEDAGVHRFSESASRSSPENWIMGRFIEEPRGKIIVR